MKNSKAVNTVYETRDYSMFKRLYDNRELKSRRLDKLLASLSEKYIPGPIIVNEKMEIIDGQGRYEAAKKLGLPVYYMVIPGLGGLDCKRMNKYNQPWTTLDYCKSWAISNPDYALLLKTCMDTGLAVNAAVSLAGKSLNAGGHSKESVIKDGELKFTVQDYETVIHRKKMGDEIKAALLFEDRLNKAFWACVKVLDNFEDYNHERMILNCRKCRSTYAQMSSVKAQLAEFERIYNYRSRSPLYITDYMRNKGGNVRSYEECGINTYKDNDVSTLEREVY